MAGPSSASTRGTRRWRCKRAIQMTDKDVPLDIVLHTPGGLVLAAMQIAWALKDHKARVTVFVPHCIKEKVTAALAAGIKTVLLPARNRRDFDDIPQAAKQQLRFVCGSIAMLRARWPLRPSPHAARDTVSFDGPALDCGATIWVERQRQSGWGSDVAAFGMIVAGGCERKDYVGSAVLIVAPRRPSGDVDCRARRWSSGASLRSSAARRR
jgi:hypothetical protein